MHTVAYKHNTQGGGKSIFICLALFVFCAVQFLAFIFWPFFADCPETDLQETTYNSTNTTALSCASQSCGNFMLYAVAFNVIFFLALTTLCAVGIGVTLSLAKLCQSTSEWREMPVVVHTASKPV